MAMSATIVSPETSKPLAPSVFVYRAWEARDVLAARLDLLKGLQGKELKNRQRWAAEAAARAVAFKVRWLQWEQHNPATAAALVATLSKELQSAVEAMRAEGV